MPGRAARIAATALTVLLLGPRLAAAAPPDDPVPEPVDEPAKKDTPADLPVQQPTAPPQPAPEPAPTPPAEATAPPLLAPSAEGPEAATYERTETTGPREDPLAGADQDEDLRRYYKNLYRPPENPMRPYLGARAWFTLGGSSQIQGGGGRMGGVNVEAGTAWNYIGWALGGTILFGQIVYGEEPEPQVNVLVGGGPSLGLGRLALVRRSILDLRVGYNFFYGATNPTVVGQADPPDVAPHGPKVQFDAQFLIQSSKPRRLRHGLGANVGWQLLVHDFSSHFPITNMIHLGIGYSFG